MCQLQEIKLFESILAYVIKKNLNQLYLKIIFMMIVRSKLQGNYCEFTKKALKNTWSKELSKNFFFCYRVVHYLYTV